MTPDDIRALRKELGCSTRELATRLGVEQSTIIAWEKADLFPTKAMVAKMTSMKEQGRRDAPSEKGDNALKALADPGLWELLRKLVAHPALRAEVAKIAARFPDPAAR